ncbi:signal protein [Streptomyces sp. NPDC006670]|uniref:signal protein n=1 Tax=Streptomyces sp. NPDC006670 TaxID=3154476 RepID=UPI0033EABB91
MHPGRSMALVIGAFVLVSGCSLTSVPSSASSGSDLPAGRMGAADLQGRWWSWAASSTSDANPVSDPDGHLCAKGQKDGVWFLAGTFGGSAKRSCTVPAGVPVAFPLVNSFGESADCAAFMASAQGSATLDGRQLEAERFEATPVQITAVEGNPVVQGGGRVRTKACGLWVQVEPLAAGSHTVGIRGSAGSFVVSVDYQLQVAAGG